MWHLYLHQSSSFPDLLLTCFDDTTVLLVLKIHSIDYWFLVLITLKWLCDISSVMWKIILFLSLFFFNGQLLNCIPISHLGRGNHLLICWPLEYSFSLVSYESLEVKSWCPYIVLYCIFRDLKLGTHVFQGK